MKIILSHPTGNTNSRNAAMALANENVLAAFYTTIGVFPNNLLDKLSKFNAFSELKRRSYDNSLKLYAHTQPLKEFGRLISQKIGLRSLVEFENSIFSIDRIYRDLDRKVAKSLIVHKNKGATGVYGYENGSIESFKKAKELGLKCFYDLPSGHWRSVHAILKEEYENRPEWGETIKIFNDSERKNINRDQELALSDTIFVASSFMVESLNLYPGKLTNIVIIPYGFPKVYTQSLLKTGLSSKKIKLLFVGNLSLQKGIANLFEAVKGLDNFVELTIVGSMPTTKCEILNKELAKHSYKGTLPNSEILELMRLHDVFVFPTLYDGFGLVISEAMSQGLPVITTQRSAGPDLIKHNINGWIVNAGSTDSLKQAIISLIRNPKLIADVRNEALATAANRPWRVYQLELIKTIMNNHN